MTENKMKYKRVVDTRMRDAGEIDFEKKLIRVNPRKREIVNTILHEELHRRYPKKNEKWIKKKAKEKESKLSIPATIKLLKKYKRGKNGK
jgi:hypothetical protein